MRWHQDMQARIRELLRHGDFLSLVLLTIVVGTVWGFIELADELMEGELEQFDTAILHLFRNPADPADPLGPRWFEELMRDATALGSVLILSLLVLCAAVSLWLENQRRAAVWLVVASAGAMILSTLFKMFFARERPGLLAPELLPSTFSFPSGHAMLAAAVYLTLGALLTRVVPKTRTRTFILAMAIVLTLLTGVSRIYLGVHYPSDVLAGWTLGLGWAALCWLFAWNILKR